MIAYGFHICVTNSYPHTKLEVVWCSQSHLQWHFRMLFQSSELKARTSLFIEMLQKRRSSFELLAFENDTPSGIGCTCIMKYEAIKSISTQIWYMCHELISTFEVVGCMIVRELDGNVCHDICVYTHIHLYESYITIYVI